VSILDLSAKSLIIGLGLGIILTATFLIFIPKESLTNEDIIERAKDLGMLDPLDLAPEKFVLSEEEIISRARRIGMIFKTENTNYLEQEDVKPDGDEEEIVTIFIPRGLKSKDISIILFENHLIDDAEEFDLYLRKVNVDRVIGDGYFNISKGSNYEKITKTLIE